MRNKTRKLNLSTAGAEEDGGRRNRRFFPPELEKKRRALARFSEPRVNSLEVDDEGDEAHRTEVLDGLGVVGNVGAPANWRWWLSVTKEKRDGRKEKMAARGRRWSRVSRRRWERL